MPIDFKFFCFHGKCKFIQLNLDRYTEHKRIFYDTEWQQQDFGFSIGDKIDVQKPNNLEDMIKTAEILAEGLSFVRVDLYNVNDQIKFGEMTFAPLCGHEKFDSYADDLSLGKMWK